MVLGDTGRDLQAKSSLREGQTWLRHSLVTLSHTAPPPVSKALSSAAGCGHCHGAWRVPGRAEALTLTLTQHRHIFGTRTLQLQNELRLQMRPASPGR